MRYHLTRTPIVLWGVTVWALLPVLPRTWGTWYLHAYLRTAYRWRRQHIPSRARLVARWEAERNPHPALTPEQRNERRILLRNGINPKDVLLDGYHRDGHRLTYRTRDLTWGRLRIDHTTGKLATIEHHVTLLNID